MKRRRVLGLTTGVLGLHAGCLRQSQQRDCHCGHRGPPKGLYINNALEESKAITIEVVASDSEEVIYTGSLEVESGDYKTLDDIIESSGRYQITASTKDQARTWKATTDKCGNYFFKLEIERNKLVKKAVPCM